MDAQPKLNRTQIRRVVGKLLDAEIVDAFKGCGNPDDYEDIERELKRAKQNYEKLLRDLSPTKG